MGAMASQITNLTIFYSTVIRAQITENIKAPRQWPLWGEFTGNRWFSALMASNPKMLPFDDVILCAMLLNHPTRIHPKTPTPPPHPLPFIEVYSGRDAQLERCFHFKHSKASVT